jgi:fibrillarin-like rRNA methylase
MVKARSEDVAAEPNRIFDAAKRQLIGAGLSVLDFRLLSAFQADHAAIVLQKP